MSGSGSAASEGAGGFVDTGPDVSRQLPPPSSSPQIGVSQSQSTVSFLETELPRLFTHGSVAPERFSPQISFEDPIVRLKGRSAYFANVQLLRTLFDIGFDLHRIVEQSSDGIVGWWTMSLKPRLLPWRPQLTLTGQSFFSVDPSGLITSHRDTWDSLSDNKYFSLEAFVLLLRGLTNVRQTPALEGPKYKVLRAADYQIRRYDPYLVAEVAMPSATSATAGDGFNDLAGYIFGGNNRSSKMEMTTPVYTTAGQDNVKMEMTSPVYTTAGQGNAATMSFPMEARFGLDPETLPTPKDARVTRRREEEKLVAAIEFAGWPLDWQVRAAERRLRGALALDGIKATDGFVLARYNDPFTLPQIRRNEVLIKLENDFDFESK